MNNETVTYIITHFPSLLTAQEKRALRHCRTMSKLSDDPTPARVKMYKKRGWLTDDPEILEALTAGCDRFLMQAAKRIMEESGGQVFLNTCPKCNRLARTPQALQCRCGNSWRD